LKAVGRRRIKLLDDLKIRRRYWGFKKKLKIEKMNMTVYHTNKRNKYKLSSTSPRTY
jgi:hypothetical protein